MTNQNIDEKRLKQDLLNHLLSFITEKRNNLFEKVLVNRTRHITVVLEDIYQSQNASAVLRTCDITGIQDVHIIENNYEYSINPDVALGSFKWLNLIKHNQEESNTIAAFDHLRKKGYKIVATTPHLNDQTIEDIPINQKIALVFGTELTGLSDTALENADEYVKIPMYGFTESFNISVSAAITLYNLTRRLRNSEVNWQLTNDEKINIKLEWAKNTVQRAEVIERHFLKSYNQ